MELKQTTCS